MLFRTTTPLEWRYPRTASTAALVLGALLGTTRAGKLTARPPDQRILHVDSLGFVERAIGRRKVVLGNRLAHAGQRIGDASLPLGRFFLGGLQRPAHLGNLRRIGLMRLASVSAASAVA